MGADCRLGMFWIFAGVVCYLLIFGLIMLDDLTRLNFYRPGDATWFFGTLERWCLVLPGIPPALMALIGGWLVTHPEAGEPATDGLFSSRNLARVWMVSACLWIAVAIQLTVAMALPVDRRPLLSCWLAYARQLALRLPRTRLAFATRLLKWVSQSCSSPSWVDASWESAGRYIMVRNGRFRTNWCSFSLWHA
jgi:hypothetical protein